ncbi:MAG: channel protein TolC, partial [Gammaproteobacteria bacterium HGW-Gammaproteobacteria-9]
MRKLNPLWSAMLIAMACTQAQAMSLTDAIQSTLENHPELRADINSRLTADEQAKMAKGGY